MEECRSCPVFASFTLAFALHLRKKQGKTSVRVAEEEDASIHSTKTPTHYETYTHAHTHTHTHTHITNTHTHTCTLQNSLKPPYYKLKQTQYKKYSNELDIV